MAPPLPQIRVFWPVQISMVDVPSQLIRRTERLLGRAGRGIAVVMIEHIQWVGLDNTGHNSEDVKLTGSNLHSTAAAWQEDPRGVSSLLRLTVSVTTWLMSILEDNLLFRPPHEKPNIRDTLFGVLSAPPFHFTVGDSFSKVSAASDRSTAPALAAY